MTPTHDNPMVTINPHKFAHIIGLGRGGHSPGTAAGIAAANKKICIMEAIAYVCDLDWGDHPRCVDSFLTNLGIWYNDQCPSARQRDKLIPLIPDFVNSAYASAEVKRQRQRTVLQRTLATLVMPVLRDRSIDEWEWFGTVLLPESDMAKRMTLLGAHMRANAIADDNIRRLYHAIQDDWAGQENGGMSVLSHLQYLTAETSATKTAFWNGVLAVIKEALQVRDDEAEGEAAACELRQIERHLAKNVPVLEQVLA
jgi:hypothetical protein